MSDAIELLRYREELIELGWMPPEDVAQLKAKLAKYESNPKRALQAVMERHNLTLNLCGDLQIGPANEKVFVSLGSDVFNEFFAEDIDTDE